jgi:adenylate kinase
MDPFMTTRSASQLLAGERLSRAASDDPSASFLLDGFPRTASQARALDDIVPVNLAVAVRTPLDVVLERISGRWVHEPSGRVYNTGFNAPRVPGRDDVTGEALVRRPDDDPDVYRARVRKFEEAAGPLVDHYARQGVLWEVEGMSSDEITPKLYREFEKRFA